MPYRFPLADGEIMAHNVMCVIGKELTLAVNAKP